MTTDTFLEIRFPDKLALECKGGPQFKTSIITNNNGVEFRRDEIQTPCFEYIMEGAFKSEAESEMIQNIFMLCMGQKTGFRFKDWADYKAVDQFIGTGDGVKTIFQVYKTYKINGNEFKRKITKLVVNKMRVKFEGLFNDNKQFKIIHNSGQIEFDSPPKAGEKIYCDFEFDVPVRFASDKLTYTAHKTKSAFYFDEIMLRELVLL